MKSINFLVVGVGGQGTILASNIIAEVGFEAGYEVIEYSNSVKVLNHRKFYMKNGQRFSCELVIEALEWVCAEIGRNNG